MELDELCYICKALLSCHWEEEKEKVENHTTYPTTYFRSFVKNRTQQVERKPLIHHNISGLEDSASQGCQLCKLLWLGFDKNEEESYSVPAHQASGLPELVFKDNETYLVVRFPHGRSCVSCLSPGDYPSSHGNIQKRLVRKIKTWLEDCHLRHEKCRNWAEYGTQHLHSDQKAARLLSVDRECDAIRLVDQAQIPSNIHYATLSHRWGGELSSMLTTKTYSQLYEGIDPSSLPKTFQDAVQVARQIGVAFLWIDALCIIQDSDEDWRKEAPKMAFIYSQSFVNLAATAASDSNGGLLCQKRTFESTYHEVSVAWSGIGGDPQSIVVGPFDSWERFIFEAPLNSRAWVAQERFLAPRTVHFSADMIRWECHQTRASEVRPKGGEISRRTDPAQDMQHYSWDALVRRYSALSLSRRSDKVVAFAGIARMYGHMEGLQDNDYLAGLWRRDFPRNLLWHTSKQTEPGVYRAPSWSWASVDFEVNTLYLSEKFYMSRPENTLACTVIEAETTTLADNAFAIVTDGFLRCQGCLLKVKIKDCVSNAEEEKVAQFVVLQQSVEFHVRKNLFEMYDDVRAMNDSSSLRLDRTDLDCTEDLDDVWFLPIIVGCSELEESGEIEPDLQREVNGILIKPEAGRNGVFRRVGHLVAVQDTIRWHEKHWTTCMLEERLYDKALGNGRYEFVLI